MFKKLEIKGRSRMGMQRIPKCSIKLVVEEKPLKDFYIMMLKGECPQGFSDMLRSVAIQSNADFEALSKMQFMLTSQGRQYRKLQFKRLCQFIEKDFRRKGMTVNRKVIKRNVLAKIAKEWTKSSEQLQDRMVFQDRSSRQQTFDA